MRVSLERVVEAGADAAHARRLVRLLRAGALSGGRHDPLVFDAAVRAHLLAERKARETLAVWARSRRPATLRARATGRSSERRAA